VWTGDCQIMTSTNPLCHDADGTGNNVITLCFTVNYVRRCGMLPAFGFVVSQKSLLNIHQYFIHISLPLK